VRRLATGLLATGAVVMAAVAAVHVAAPGPSGVTAALLVTLLLVDVVLLALAAAAVAGRWRRAEWWALLVVGANVLATVTDEVGAADLAFLGLLVVTAAVLLRLARERPLPGHTGPAPPGE
jgi:hypothetical protein